MSELIVEPCREFYFVWTKMGHIPRRCHDTLESAQAEASRLASLIPHGKKYIVLRAVSKHHFNDELCAVRKSYHLPENDASASPSSPAVGASVHSRPL